MGLSSDRLPGFVLSFAPKRAAGSGGAGSLWHGSAPES